MKGDFHARFLGGWGAVTFPGYPVVVYHIRLEYEGRYAAMYSNEIKNYALLTYDGRLIVHGSGLRNSQSPPFAARFLHDALGYLLGDNVSAVVGLYQATVQRLRERSYSLTEVAIRTRLTKTPAEYLRSRGRLREPQYEALLDAGRERWQVGELVRYYRAAGERPVWLPYAPDEVDITEVQGGGVGPVSASEVLDNRWMRGYDLKYYTRLLRESYLSRLRKAFRDQDFERLFSDKTQVGLYDRWLTNIHPRWIEAPGRE